MKHRRFQYLESLAGELLSQASRVRDLIGESHWLSDGHHHETVLKTVLRRHVGERFIVERGFVLDPTIEGGNSTEQDILIIDAEIEKPLFLQHGLAITLPQNVIAAISVKASLDKQKYADALKGLRSLEKHLRLYKPQGAWAGIFAFQLTSENIRLPSKWWMDESEHGNEFMPNIVGCADGLIMKKSSCHNKPTLINCGEMASAVFIADLLDYMVSSSSGGDAALGRLVDAMEFKPLSD